MPKVVHFEREGARTTLLTDDGRVFESFLDANGHQNWSRMILPVEIAEDDLEDEAN